MAYALPYWLIVAAGFGLAPVQSIVHEDPDQWSYSDFPHSLWSNLTAPRIDANTLVTAFGPPAQVTSENLGWAFEMAEFKGYGVVFLLDSAGRRAIPKLYFARFNPTVEFQVGQKWAPLARFVMELANAGSRP